MQLISLQQSECEIQHHPTGTAGLAHCSENCQGRYSKSEVMVIASHQLYVTCHILWSSTWFQQQSPVNKDSVKRHYVAYV